MKELEVVLDLLNLIFALLGIISVLLRDVVQPERGVLDLGQPLLEHHDLSVLLGLLLKQVIGVDFECIDVRLNLGSMVL